MKRKGYYRGGSGTTIDYENNISQDDISGYANGGGALSASSTDNISDQSDAPGSNAENSATVMFLSTSTRDLHLAASDTIARGQGANLSNDPNYAFNYDIDGQTRPTSTAWDIGADEYPPPATQTVSPPTITSFVMTASSNSETVSITSFTANGGSSPVTEYLITESSTVPSSTNPNWAILVPTSFTFAGAGTRIAYAWVMDTAGNISSSTSQTVVVSALKNIYYSIGQSTSTNLETGSSTMTLTFGAAVFSIPQTGNIGVGDRVSYGTSSVAYISAKTSGDDEHWTLVTATGGVPADVVGASVTSINRVFASLSAALSGAVDANHIGTSSLVSANVVLNLPCYYDTGPDTVGVSIPSSIITSSSTYLDIFTPNNTSTQANFSQRHTGTWTTNAYRLVVSGGGTAIDIQANYTRIVGLQVELISSSNYQRDVRMDSLSGPGGYVVLASNIIRSQLSGTPIDPQGIGSNAPTAAPTAAIVNNIVYDVNGTSSAYGIFVGSGTYYLYNNTVYNTYNAYSWGLTGTTTTISVKNNIAQDDTVGYGGGGGTNNVDAASTNNLSDQGDAPGINPENFKTVNFVSPSTRDLHLAPFNPLIVDGGTNLSGDPNYAFKDDIDGQARPYGLAWDIGADEYYGATYSYAPPTVTSFTMPATASSVIVSISSFTATDTPNPVAAYLITESSATPSSTNPNWATSAPSTFIFGGIGTRTAYAWAMDAYGDISASASETVMIIPSFAAVSSSSSLAGTFFSMDWNHYLTGAGGSLSSPLDWPSVPFGGIRLWDNYVSWEEIETASGTYNWAALDQWLAAAQASGTDVLYAFGRTPPWASSNPGQACGYGVGCAAPPSDIGTGDNIWKSFVTALVEHSLASSTAHIKYYEIWNEPDCTTGCTWTGTVEQMVTMARDAYTIIHTLDPNALVLGPSPHGLGLVNWLQGYYAAGGAPYQDIVPFHAYVGADPSIVLSIVNNMRTLMSQYGIGNEPIWTTEGSWGIPGLTPSQQAAYLAQEYIHLWSSNVARYYWYSWDGVSQFGLLWTSSSGVSQAGIAYGQLYRWLVGSVSPSNPCYQTADATWYCSLTLATGEPAEMVWNPNTMASKSVSPAFTTYQTLDNGTANRIVENTVAVGNEPILLVVNGNPAPVVTAINAASLTTTSATITWTTDQSADSTVYYGIEASYGTSSADPIPTVFHTITVSGLSPGTTYHYMVQSWSGGIAATSSDHTFTTPAAGSGGGSVSVSGGGGGGNNGFYAPIPQTSTSTSTAPVAPTSILPTTHAGLRSYLAQLESELRALLERVASQATTVPGASSSTPYVFTRNLALQSRGADVQELQHYLNVHGFPVVSTSTYAGSLGYETIFFGRSTQATLVKFQKSVGISPSVGYFGPKTRAYVNGHE